tara:strand:- start:1955 stop:3133 length:1179 start_codon:yes stop_codon:yes gene_type:complete
MSFLIYPTIKESPYLSMLGMGGGGTGTALGGGGPNLKEDYNTNTYYVIIPYYSSSAGGSGNRIALFNPTTGKYAADFETSISSGKIYRFGDSIVITSNGSSWFMHYHYLNNWSESYSNFYSGYIGDEVKIASDRLFTVSWGSSGSSTANIRVFSVGLNGLTNTNNYTQSNIGTRNSYYGMISNPVLGAQANVTSSTGILSSLTRIHGKAPHDNSSNAWEKRFVLNISNTSTGQHSVQSYQDNSGNYSRPIAGTGWDGYCYTSGMDGARTYVTNGSSAVGWSGPQVTPPANGFHGVGTLGTSGRFLTVAKSGSTHYFAYVTSGSVSYQYSIPTTTGAHVQQYPNGAATCDYDSAESKIRVRILNGNSWTSMYAATEHQPNHLHNYNFRKIITY